MEEKIENIANKFQEKLASTTNHKTLQKLKKQILGKDGAISELTSQLGTLKPEERKKWGQKINQLKEKLAQKIEEKENLLAEKKPSFKQEWLDISLPGEPPELGHLHPITQTIYQIENIFHRLGFVRRRYPEVETDWYAFESLNMPENHPARDEWETFYIDGKRKAEGGRWKEKNTALVLTPHTSSGQVREMQKYGAPIRMINISRCDRRQADISHAPTFYQFEGLVIDKNINITHLKGTLDFFVREYFGKDRTYRLRPYDFRFTEPSFEIDVSCALCDGKGCRYCSGGWSELGGAGMVHPEVLKNGDLDPEKVSGFAFGWGVERVFLMNSNLNIDDLRVLYQNKTHFLEQF